MRILLTMQHPADVHFFRHAVDHLEASGHNVRVLVRERSLALTLLDHYGIDHRLCAGPAHCLLELAHVQARYELDILRQTRAFEPDVIAGVSEPGIAHVGAITNTPSVVFSDTEHATGQNSLAYPFADRIVTPECYRDDLGAKQVQYPGYHELAYLHPDRFVPDEGVLNAVRCNSEKPLAVLRLVSWNAAHDIGHSGFSDASAIVSKLESAGAVVRISAEGTPPASLEGYELDIPPHRIHDVLACADLFLGESATMAAESAVLGTPVVYVSSLRLGYLDELESRYGLVFNYSGPDRQERGLETALSILRDDTVSWSRKRADVLAEAVDSTDVITDQLLTVGRHAKSGVL